MKEENGAKDTPSVGQPPQLCDLFNRSPSDLSLRKKTYRNLRTFRETTTRANKTKISTHLCFQLFLK